MLYLLRREPGQVVDVANQLEELSSKHSFTFMSLTAKLWRSWVDAYLSPEPENIHALREASEAWWASGAGNYKPFFLTLIAELTLKTGDREAAFQCLAEARRYQSLTNEGWAQAETDRVYALAISESRFAEVEFCEALNTAKRQQAKMYELRIVVDYIKSCQKFRQTPAPNFGLSAVLETIIGGELTADVNNAQNLLDQTTLD